MAQAAAGTAEYYFRTRHSSSLSKHWPLFTEYGSSLPCSQEPEIRESILSQNESSQFNNDFAILPSIAASGPLSSGSQTVIEQTYTGLGPRIRTFSLFVWVSLESDKLSTLPCKLSHDCHRVSGCMPTSDKIESKYVTKHFTHEATYTNHTIFKFTKYADTLSKIRRKQNKVAVLRKYVCGIQSLVLCRAWKRTLHSHLQCSSWKYQ